MKTIFRNTFFSDTLTILIIAAVVAVGLQAVVQKFAVKGHSMDLTLEHKQQLIVNKVVYKFHQPERGDIIIFHSPFEEEEWVKRIIGLPGESVEIKDGKVYIHKKDGTVLPLDEPYVTRPATEPFRGGVIPENQYFVMGDNRTGSSDSRNGWTLPQKNIIGKAWLSIWPPHKWGLVPHYSFEEPAK